MSARHFRVSPVLWQSNGLARRREGGLKMDIKCFLGSLHVFGKDDSVVEGGTGEMKKQEKSR